MLKAALSEAQHTKVLIDGFPRVADQLAEFEAQVRARACVCVVPP
jgi:adenylate kinase family enzyme